MRRLVSLGLVTTVAGLTVVSALTVGCSREDTTTVSTGVSTSTAASTSASAAQSSVAGAGAEVTLTGVQGRSVVLTGPIARKYAAATAVQKKNLGKPLDGDHNAGKRASGVVFQQFKGGVIVAKDSNLDTPAFITWGKIRDAWNVERAPDGKPSLEGKNGSAGPLGVPISDEVMTGAVKSTRFEHGKITYNTKNGKVTVWVNGKVVPGK